MSGAGGASTESSDPPEGSAMNAQQARPTRRDALRNKSSVLAAAADVLSDRGPEATMELIASRAGVGVGTVYRHFPNKDALIDELVRTIFAELIAAASDAVARDDGAGLEELLRVLGRAMAQHRGYAHLLAGHTVGNCGADVLRKQLAVLLEQAKAAGEIGPDVTLGDVMSTIWAVRGVIETSAVIAPAAWERHLDIHLFALRSASVASTRRSVSARELSRIAAATAARYR
jgi:AcrR family transcriptional regulator